MSFDGHDFQCTEDIASQLVDSYESANEHALPSGEGVVSIASEIIELFFPGFGRMRRVSDRGDQVHEVARSLTWIEARLQREISRAVGHAQQLPLRIHSEQDGNLRLPSAATLTNLFLRALPSLRTTLQTDVQAAFDGDPAAHTPEEIILCYPGIHAVCVYRMAHELHRLNVPYLPRILTEWAHRETGIDIHPGAKIGPRFFIDHGTGVVIGETAEVGAGVTLYQGVTLGAWSFPRDENGNLIRGQKRHPTLQDNVTVYSNASILGGTTVIGAGSQIGSGVTLSRSIAANTIVTVENPSLRIREAG